ncbi:MAG: hypothetical protein Q8830_03775, partial [Candidatus Phytoplasma australasiaticum]|nr:hypothetical protein [Candidatus Phytoplasma australasiaticum]
HSNRKKKPKKFIFKKILERTSKNKDKKLNIIINDLLKSLGKKSKNYYNNNLLLTQTTYQL